MGIASACATGEQETLDRLGADEARLERAIAEARAEAAVRIEAAHREAEALAALACQEAEREADAVRAAAAEEIDRLAAGAEDAVLAEAEELRRRAGRNRPRALARIVDVVLGRAG